MKYKFLKKLFCLKKYYKQISIILVLSILATVFYRSYVKYAEQSNCSQENHTNVLIYDDWATGLGDHEAVMRLLIAAQNLGYGIVKHSQVISGCKFKEGLDITSLLVERGERSNKILKLDKYQKGIKKFFIVWGSAPKLLETYSFNELNDYYRERFKTSVNGYLVTYPKQVFLKRDLNEINKNSSADQLELIMSWYPTVYRTEFKQLSYEKLMFSGGGWDNLRQSERYRQVYGKLAEQGYFVVYGALEHAELWQFIKDSYKGYIPSDGRSFLSEAAKNGISLVLHSQFHLDNGVPSSRVFEGAAASTIMICDNHPFVQKEFGDSVFYIDHNADAETMFKQIDDHIQWIKKHPKEAAAKARKAHKIFLNKFTLEDQLKRLKEYD
ncbi:MAG: hypothetical protein K0Q51_298 [Rickettsiaceae bacterium]|jgi:hypothetical protein|nr:hypothetical protein [Rickettsiaceae bacterium]